MNNLVIALLTFTFCCAYINSLQIGCEFKIFSWWINLENLYHCNVPYQGELVTDRSYREVDHITGTHYGSNTNDDVKGIAISRVRLHYFPIGMEKFFKNIESIGIYSTNLKEIRQQDVKPFTKLKCFGIYSTDIEVIEANLFEFNTKLDRIYMVANKVSHIDPKALDSQVGKMIYLWLASSSCQLENANKDMQKANEIIAKIQSGICKDEAKLEEFKAQAPTTTTTPSPNQCISESQLDEKLYEIMKQMTAKMDEQKKEFDEELKIVKKELTECKNNLGTILGQDLGERVSYIEKEVGIRRNDFKLSQNP